MTPDQIKSARLSANLSMSAFAALMGVTRMTVHNWEHGIHPLSERDEFYMLAKLKDLKS